MGRLLNRRQSALVEGEFKPVGEITGAGFEELRWPRPVRPGDELRAESEILHGRPPNARRVQRALHPSP
jgi:acyl dehydratase